jgi:hypothetical protein
VRPDLSLALGRSRRRLRTLGFNPLQVTSVVSGEWYRNSTVGALTTWPALINTGSPGTPGAGGAANRPTGNGDYSITLDGNDDLRVPLATPNNGAVFWGFGLWIKPTLSGQLTLYNCQSSSGASSTKARIDVFANGSVQAVSLTSGAAASSAGVLVANVPKFLSVEYNGDRALGSRWKFFVDGADVTASDSAPAALNTPTGNSEVGANDGSGSNGFNGTIGRSFFFYGSAEAGSASGLLTTLSRAGLRTVDPLAA